MRIIIDAFGGDNAPLEIIKGAVLAKKEADVDITLVGDSEIIKKVSSDNGIDVSSFDIIHTTEVFNMEDKPTDIIKSKKNTSLAVALQTVADGNGDAFLSAGSTGAIVAGGTFIIKRIKGVKRPAIGSMIPGRDRKFMMMDVGANADCRPEMLAQFGVMASVYLENVMGVKNPEIGLLNIGTEETKGGELQLEAFSLLKNSNLNFIGNVEARDIPKGVCDAVITDGFTGNVALKLYEGVSSTIFSMLKSALYKNLKNKLAALVIKKDLYEIKKKADYSEIGGAPLLGVNKPVIKAHGSSDAKAIKNAILLAKAFAENNVIEKISAGLQSVSKDEA